MKRPTICLIRIKLIAAVLLCTGCAVLTVDIDVYKGPLANHEGVQTEQLAAIAIGAKPLLIALRKTLETEVNEKLHPDGPTLHDLKRIDPDRAINPGPDQVYESKTDNTVEVRLFASDHASRVDAVIGLYEDRAAQAEGHRAKIIEALDDAIIRLKDYEQANQVRERLKKQHRTIPQIETDGSPQLAPKTAATGLFSALKDQQKNINAFVAKRNSLIAAVNALILGDKVVQTQSSAKAPEQEVREQEVWPQKEIFGRLKTLGDLLLANQSLHPDSYEQRLKHYLGDSKAKKPWTASSNALFQALTDPLLSELLGQAATDDTEFAKKVAADIRSYAHAILKRREAIHELLRDALLFIVHFDQPEFADDPNRQEYLEFAANFAAPLIYMTYLREIIQEHGTLFGLPPDVASAFSSENRSWNWEAAQAVVRASLQAGATGEAAQTARELLLADDLFKRKRATNFERNEQAIGKFGISYDSRIDKDLAAEAIYIAIAQGNLKEFREYITSGGFGGGRLDDGLETLTEDYLNSARKVYSKNIKNDDSDVSLKRNALHNALVRFAEKVLFVANYDKLIAEIKDKTQRDSIRKYTLVLQAAGSSILSQADELRHRVQYNDGSKARADRERDGWRRAKNPSVYRVDDETDPRYVLDVLIAQLHKERVEAIKDNQPIDAERLAKAIKATYDRRASMVYIRPPSAYLRSSYPATALQDNQGTQWHNMLQEHSFRQLPFADLFNRTEDVKLQAQIDKQFWQNINRVRVAGAGNTNYVVAKDDIGNWYVKQYAADPSPIIEGMAGLVSAAASGGLDLQRLRELDERIDKGGKPDPSTKSPNESQPNTLAGNLDHRYKEQLKQFESNELKPSVNEITSQIIGHWQELKRTGALTEQQHHRLMRLLVADQEQPAKPNAPSDQGNGTEPEAPSDQGDGAEEEPPSPDEDGAEPEVPSDQGAGEPSEKRSPSETDSKTLQRLQRKHPSSVMKSSDGDRSDRIIDTFAAFFEYRDELIYQITSIKDSAQRGAATASGAEQKPEPSNNYDSAVKAVEQVIHFDVESLIKKYAELLEQYQQQLRVLASATEP